MNVLKRLFTTAALLCALASAAAPASASAAAPTAAKNAAPAGEENDRRPYNLIFIMTDDQGAWSIGAYGNEEAVTPNIDRLAGQGARFTNAFAASPVCTPSRVSFLTGLYPTQSGFPYIEDPMPDGRWSGGLPTGAPSWPRELKKSGYKTGLVGKWHLGRTPKNNPLRYGIDYFYGFHRGGSHPMNPWLFRNDESEGRQVKGSLPDILTDDAMAFVERHKDQPFALMVHYRAPHSPYGPVPDEDMTPYEGLDPTLSPSQKSYEVDNDYVVRGARPWPEAREMHEGYVKRRLLAYYASVHSVDRNVGRLMARLDALGLDERTIVVFTSDQGYMVGHRGFKGKGGASPVRSSAFRVGRASRGAPILQANLYDISMRIPLMVRWPGVVKPGLVVDSLVSNVDAPVSILSMLSVAAPDDWPTNGRDFAPLLRDERGDGDNGADRRDEIFGAIDIASSFFNNAQFVRSIRTDRWKLVRTYFAPGRGGALYDLKQDPNETTNLYYPKINDDAISDRTTDWDSVDRPNPHQEIRDDLEARLLAWQEDIGDPILDADRAYAKNVSAARAKWTPVKED